MPSSGKVVGPADPILSHIHGVVVETAAPMPGWPAASSGDVDRSWRVKVTHDRPTLGSVDLAEIVARLEWPPEYPSDGFGVSLSLAGGAECARIDIDREERVIAVSATAAVPRSAEGAEFGLAVRVLPLVAFLERGSLTLHATAVRGPSGAVLLCGESGSGKSTTTAVLAAAGWKLLGDEPVVVDAHSSGVVAWPGQRHLRLGDGSPAVAALSDQGWRLVPSWDKLLAEPPDWAQPAEPVPVAAIVLLDQGTSRPIRGDALRATRLSPLKAAGEILAHRFSPESPPGRLGADFASIAALVNTVPVVRLDVPYLDGGVDQVRALGARIVSLMGELA